MDTILTFLKQLELSEIEAKLYLTLLQHGPKTVRELAETIEIKRTTAYFYIDQLVEKSLIMKIVKGSKKLVAANPPESLQHLVEEKVKSAKEVEQNFPNILKTLALSLPQAIDTGDSEIKYYKGKNGIEKTYKDALSANEFRSYIKLIEAENAFPDNVSLFRNALKQNPTLIIKELFYDSPLARQEAQIIAAGHSRYSYKFLPKDMKLNSEDILIYDGKVAIIHYQDEKNSDSVVLQNMNYYNNSKELFDFVWNLIPEINK